MKAIILAGGTGSRLYPLTLVSSKQLQAVYDKPMIYYPLTVLIAAGIREFCLITTPRDQASFEELLGDGSQWGISIEYRAQPKPEGIGQAFIIAETFVAGENVVLMLGDNIFFGGDAFPRAMSEFRQGASIFAYHVRDPQAYGVVEFDGRGTALSIEEKPANPKSSYAVPGVYLYDGQVVEIAKKMRPSKRGEIEITDINRAYLDMGQLQVRRLSRGFAWLDAGTSSTLQEASAYIETIERRQGVKIGCPEEAALVRNFLSLDQFESLVATMPDCEYRAYLASVAAEMHRLAEHSSPSG
jgi:glucose-1-phosphate thymidylyltransferase